MVTPAGAPAGSAPYILRVHPDREAPTTDLRERLQATLAGTYELEHELGGGGMSRVFLAHETALGRKVVVKVLLPTLAAGVSAERFRREILVVAKLQHPHIVPVHAAGESDGLPWFTMPFVEGESLRARIAREGELPIAEVLRLLRDIASALSYAHGHGVIHRDIKPDNVLLSAGSAVVADFGVAKALSDSVTEGDQTHLTSLGIALGTPTYMAPEQASADPAMDHRVDIYAFGVMAYEMLAGRPPFTGRNAQAMFAAHFTEAPPPLESLRPTVPAVLAGLVMRCLEKHAADRPTAADDILYVLDAVSTPSGGNPPTTEYPVPRRRGTASKRARLSWVGAAVAAAAAIGAVTLLPLGESPAGATGDSAATTAALTAPAPESAAGPAAVAQAADSLPGIPAPAPRPPADPVRRADEQLRRSGGDDARRRSADRPPPLVVTEPPAAPRDTAGRAAEAAAPAGPSESIPAPPAAREPEPRTPPSPPPPADDPRPAVESIVSAYAAAIESRSTARIRNVYPGLTSVQEQDWRQFFDAVGDVQATLRVTDLEVIGDVAEATAAGEYVFENSTTRRTESQPASVRMTFRRASGGAWRLAEIR